MGEFVNFLTSFGFLLKKMEKKDLEDGFFKSFKLDYPEFEDWFIRKSENNEQAFYFYEKGKIIGFIKIKIENNNDIIENEKIIKICSYKLLGKSVKFADQTFIEIFNFSKKHNIQYIYGTVYSKHKSLINKMLKLGFVKFGFNKNKENILLKNLNFKN